MIPVLIVPCLRGDLVGNMLATVDVPVDRFVIIDNGGEVAHEAAIHLPANLGVAASWNLGIKLTIEAPWWFITNDDITYAPGDLANLAALMSANSQPLLAVFDGFASFAINAAALETVGWFDENFHPAYLEDCDYEYRCKLAGVPIAQVHGNFQHLRSATLADPRWRRENQRTYKLNYSHYQAKWGGNPRGGESIPTPFGGVGTVSDWHLSPDRLRGLQWHG